MLGWARPVRITPNSSLATATALSIVSSVSRRVSSIISAPMTAGSSSRAHVIRVNVRLPVRSADQGADFFAVDGPDHVALPHQGEHHDRQAVVHGQADRGGVHDLQAAGQHLAVIDLVEALGVRVLARVGVVHPVDRGALEHGFGADLERALGGAGVGGEERRAAPGPEDHDPALSRCRMALRGMYGSATWPMVMAVWTRVS